MKDANGKDAEGLAYVSQKLGAQSVIASLWPVDDVGTQVLMPLFYRLRLSGVTKAEAFQRAQLALLHGDVKDVPGVLRSSEAVSESKSGSGLNRFAIDPQRPFAHPFYWAPFVLIGNWK
jgi:CHAT domain-containing protein